MGERLVLAHQVAGHVGGVGELGAVHEVIHGRAARVAMGKVEVSVAPVA